MTCCASCIRDIRGVEAKLKRPDRHPRRPAGPEAPHRHLRRTRKPASTPATPSSSTPTRRRAMPRASTCRIRRSSPRAQVGDNLLLNDGRLRVEIIKAEPDAADDAGDLRRHAVRPQGREPARHGHSHSGADREGPLRSRSRGLEAGVDWIALSFVQRAGRHGRGAQADRRPRRRHGQDREAAALHRASTRSSRLPTP